MPSKESRILLDAEVLVKLAYLTMSEEADLKNLETLRLTYEQGEKTIIGEETPVEESLELTPLDELRQFCEEALKASANLMNEEEGK
ncbi:MAG: hypothetical protein QXF52_03045 [Thermoproteota archaeon]